MVIAYIDTYRGQFGVQPICRVLVWQQLRREDIPAARYTVERLMRAAGLVGVRRGVPKRTTVPANRGAWPPDLVSREFRVDAMIWPAWCIIAITAARANSTGAWSTRCW